MYFIFHFNAHPMVAIDCTLVVLFEALSIQKNLPIRDQMDSRQAVEEYYPSFWRVVMIDEPGTRLNVSDTSRGSRSTGPNEWEVIRFGWAYLRILFQLSVLRARILHLKAGAPFRNPGTSKRRSGYWGPIPNGSNIANSLS